MRFALGLLFVFGLIAACQPVVPDTNDTVECIEGYISINGTCVLIDEPIDKPDVLVPLPDDDQLPSEETGDSDNLSDERFDVVKTITVYEGDRVSLKPKAVDPDGDTIVYTFSKPFDADGEWQTSRDDAGNYFVTVTASDGTLTTSVDVLVKVLRKNSPPAINCPTQLEVDEGALANLGCDISDPDGDDYTVEYSGWMTAARKQTNYDDAGTYTVTVSAKDADNDAVSKTIRVIVKDTNRAPVIEQIDDISVVEGKLVKAGARASDPDGDDVTLAYSAPLDADGEWQTAKGDAGTRTVTVTASDGSLSAKETLTITVTKANTAPVITGIDNVVVSEGDTVSLAPQVSDPDGDDVDITYSGWMTAAQKQTGYDDEGTYQVKVTADDGELKSEKTITVTVLNKNRPPEFVIPA